MAVAAAVRGSGGSPSVQRCLFAFVVGLVGNSEVISSGGAGVSRARSSSSASFFREVEGDLRRFAAGCAALSPPAASRLLRRGAAWSGSADPASFSGCGRSLEEVAAGASLWIAQFSGQQLGRDRICTFAVLDCYFSAL